MFSRIAGAMGNSILNFVIPPRIFVRNILRTLGFVYAAGAITITCASIIVTDSEIINSPSNVHLRSDPFYWFELFTRATTIGLVWPISAASRRYRPVS